MHGNVYQWCEDLYDPKLSGISVVNRGYRGGTWGSDAAGCRAGNRKGTVPGGRLSLVGFRLARVPVEAK
jgi:formylglycine-generating enzyme required for sulfatase activity